MNSKFELLYNEGVSESQWNDLAIRSGKSSFFQSPKGFHLLSQYSNWQVEVVGVAQNRVLRACVVLVIQKENGIKSFLSKRGVIFSGPLFDDVDALQFLLKNIEAFFKGCIYFEVRNGYQNFDCKEIYENLGWIYIPWLNFVVDTRDEKLMRSAMSESRRRQLKKAEKLGVYTRNPKTIYEVQEFYQMLCELYLKRVNKPIPDLSFFEKFYNADTRNFVLVFFKDKVIGGILCPFLDSVGLYEFYISGLDQEYKDCYPSAMATYGAMKQAHDMGIPKFDFMGGGSPSSDYGVRDFKARFGGAELELGRWLKIRNKWVYRLGQWYVNRKMK